MGAGKAAALAATLLATAPAGAQEIQDSIPTTMFYISIPLGGATVRERMPSYGLAWKGKKQFETVTLDSRMLGFNPLAAIEAKWLIAGGLAVAAGVYVSRKDDGRSDGYNNNQNNQQNSPPPPPPHCTDPCAKK
jgi:hypothetical protein